MKKRNITLWVSCSMIVLGLILAIIGASLGAGFGYFRKYDSESFTREYTQQIKSVDIDYKIGKLTIKKGDVLKIVADDVRKDSVRTDVSGDKMTIDSDKDSFPFYFSNHSELIVYIPYDIEEFYVSAGVGELSIENITAENVTIKAGVGETNIENLTAKKTNIKSGVGEFNIHNSNLSDLDLNSGIGQVNINCTLSGDCDIDAGIGEINLNLDTSIDDYRFDFSNGIGDITINGESYKHFKHNDGKYRMNVKNGIGDIEINMN